MSIITEESGVCISPTGGTLYESTSCGPLATEEDAADFILPDGTIDPPILLDGTCEPNLILTFKCDVDRKDVASGKNVIIRNTCPLPLEITGFVNSDSLRFSLFEYPTYQSIDIYDTGTAPDYFPIKLDQFEKIVIPAFFHPTQDELENGTPGTYYNRIGDKFNAQVDIYPGFSVQNCKKSENECEAYFTLSGEFICDDIDVPDWLDNNTNFIVPDPESLPTGPGTTYCIPNTGNLLYSIGAPYGTPQIYAGLAQSALALAAVAEIDPVWNNDQRVHWSGALGTFYKLVVDVINAGQTSSLNNLLNSSVTNYPVSCPKNYPGGPQGEVGQVECSYTSQNTLVFAGLTGMNFDIERVQNAGASVDSTVYFRTVGQSKVLIMIADSGDPNTYNFCA